MEEITYSASRNDVSSRESDLALEYVMTIILIVTGVAELYLAAMQFESARRKKTAKRI